MPLEIRSLVIKATISNGEAAQSSGGGGQDKTAIVAACVDQVLAILKEKSER